MSPHWSYLSGNLLLLPGFEPAFLCFCSLESNRAGTVLFVAFIHSVACQSTERAFCYLVIHIIEPSFALIGGSIIESYYNFMFMTFWRGCIGMSYIIVAIISFYLFFQFHCHSEQSMNRQHWTITSTPDLIVSNSLLRPLRNRMTLSSSFSFFTFATNPQLHFGAGRPQGQLESHSHMCWGLKDVISSQRLLHFV